jgi:hypothetical protein
MKEIYSFTVDLEKKVTKKVQKTVLNKETKEEEKIEVEEEITEEDPIRVILREPNRRQVEEADMEYSIEMSQCVKRGILTKAMLAKKYSDTGGLLAEEDAKNLNSRYAKLADLQTSFTKLATKTGKKTKEDKEKRSKILADLAELRREIIDIETSYASLFNHTADVRAQNHVIMWYVLNLTYVARGEEDPKLFFEGETHEEKEKHYYDLDEKNDELYILIQNKIATFMSYWYFAASELTKEDFDQLNTDIEEGDV